MRGRLAQATAVIERHPLLTVLVVAVVPRLLIVAVTHAFDDGLVFPSEHLNHGYVVEFLSPGGREAWSPRDHNFFRGTAGFLLPLAALYRVFGSSPLVGQLFVVAFGAGAAALTTRLALEMVEARYALVAGAVVALLPSQALWSSLLLKDALVWCAVAAVAVIAAQLGRSHGRRLAVLVAALAGLLGFLGVVRLQAAIIAAVAVAIAAVAGRREARATRILLVLVVAVTVLGALVAWGPWFLRAGTSDPLRLLGQYRRNLAIQGDLDVVPEDVTADSLGDHLAHLPRGVSVVLFEPYPWQATGGPLDLARVETVVWYPVLGLGLFGLAWGWRRHVRVLTFPVLYGGALVLLYALAEGNLGTAYRHRGDVVWAVALGAALGARALVSRTRAAPPGARSAARG